MYSNSTEDWLSSAFTNSYTTTALGLNLESDELISTEKAILVLSSVITASGVLNKFILVFLVKFCSLQNTFNMYIVFICITDMINSFFYCPLAMVQLLKPATRTILICRLRIFLRTASYFLALVVATEISLLRFLSVVAVMKFKRFLQTKYIVGSVLLIQLLCVPVALPVMQLDSMTMLVCLQRNPTNQPPKNYWLFHVTLTLVALVFILVCYIGLNCLIRRHDSASTIPANQQSILMTLKVGIVVTTSYFLFYFTPLIWAVLRSAFLPMAAYSGRERMAQADLNNILICLQSCINPLLYTLPSRRFRQNISRLFRGPCRNRVAPVLEPDQVKAPTAALSSSNGRNLSTGPTGQAKTMTTHIQLTPLEW